MKNAFLTADWRQLAMLNFEVDPTVLRGLVPAGTELDSWNGRTLASLVGFLFLNTKVGGVPVPFHRSFTEVNLRFYVRRKAPEGWRRGVVFVKEIVPRAAVAAVARVIYDEPYVALPMRYDVKENGDGVSARYEWRFGKRWHFLEVRSTGEPRAIVPGSDEEFITEHYWGYTAHRRGGASEYQVEHPRWRVWTSQGCDFDCDVAGLYGHQFVESLSARPRSAFLVEGSPVTVRPGRRFAG
jgi:uncharacterized protein